MSEQTKPQVGDGQDSFGNATRQMAKMAKMAKNGAKVAANGVKTGVNVGKTAGTIAAGATAGGVWGTAISAAWSMRHTLFKILVVFCIAVVLLIVIIVSIPSIIFESIFSSDYDGTEEQPTIISAYNNLSYTIDGIIETAFDSALKKVDEIIVTGGYDREYSMKNLSYTKPSKNDYDTCYILAAYSASQMQQNAKPENMKTKLSDAMDEMFPITYEVKQGERSIETEDGTKKESFEYIVCEIKPFDNSSIIKAFDIDLNAKYGNGDTTYGEAIDYMATALEKTMNGE